MKITKKSSLRRNLLILLPVVLVVVSLGAFGYRQWARQNKPNDNSGINYNPPTKEQKEAGQNIKNSTVNDSTSGKPNAPGTDLLSPSSGDTTVAVTITAANQNGNTLNVRSLIGSVTSSGTCTLTLTHGSTVVTKTSGIQPLANSSTCKGFDISTSELTKGEWSIRLDVSIGAKAGTASKNIAIQ